MVWNNGGLGIAEQVHARDALILMRLVDNSHGILRMSDIVRRYADQYARLILPYWLTDYATPKIVNPG